MTFYVRAVPMRVLGKWHIGRIRRRAVCFQAHFQLGCAWIKHAARSEMICEWICDRQIQ